MTDMEKMIQKALLAASVDDQGVPDIDDQVRLVAQALTTSEHEPNRVVKRLRAALASLPDPLPTVESARAAARAEYEAELREASTKWHEAARTTQDKAD
jgi:hypothetical protein